MISELDKWFWEMAEEICPTTKKDDCIQQWVKDAGGYTKPYKMALKKWNAGKKKKSVKI